MRSLIPYFILIAIACTIHGNYHHQHFQIISNQFDCNNYNIDYSQYMKLDDHVLHTKNKTIKYKMQQMYDGIPIFGATLVVEKFPLDSGRKRAIFGKYYNKTAISIQIGNSLIRIDKETAIEITLHHIQINSNDIRFTQINSYIYYHTNHEFYIIWLIHIGYMETNQAFIIINAKTGHILKFGHIRTNAVRNTIHVCGDGGNIKTGKYTYCDGNDAKYPSLQIDSLPLISNSYFIMMNRTKPFQCKLPVSDRINGAYCVVCDAYYHLSVSFQLYLNWMQMLPLAMDRLPIYVQIHHNISNAIYTYKGTNSFIILGDGDHEHTFPWVSLDIVAHEVAHGFTNKAAGFMKFGEPSALEEAYSDLVSECAKYYLNGHNNWRFGADIMKKPYDIALRVFNDPQIRNYKIQNDDLKTPSDLSGIYMKAFYVLNTKYHWSMKQLFIILSTANLYYWTADSTLNEALCGIYEVISDLYESDSAKTMKKELFDVFNDVGIQCIVSQVTNIEEIEPDEEYWIRANTGESKYYTFTVNSAAMSATSCIKIRLEPMYGHLGDADLYIARDWIPSDLNYECKSNQIGNHEECMLSPNLHRNQTYYVMVYGFTGFKEVSLSWSVSYNTEIEWTEIMFNVPFIVNPNQIKYFYVDLSAFDYKLGSYLTLNGLSSNANGSLQYEIHDDNHVNEHYDVIDTKPGIYYIQIHTNALHDESEEFMVELKYKQIYQIHCNEYVIVISNDWTDKYLFFNLSSLDHIKQLQLHLKGEISLTNGALDLYNDDGLLLCSIFSSRALNECLIDKRHLNLGIYYIKYYGFIQSEIAIHLINALSWNALPGSSAYALPNNIENTEDVLFVSMDDRLYLLDGYAFIYTWYGSGWDQDSIRNSPRSPSLHRVFVVVAGQRYVYMFHAFTEIYKFDTENKAFVENDITITDPRYEYTCVASDDINHDIYFIGNNRYPLLMYNWIGKQWIFAQNIHELNPNERISCSVLSYGNHIMLFAFISQRQEIWSYTKQYDFWYLLDEALAMNRIEFVLKTKDHVLYLFGDSNHMQTIRAVDINDIEYTNETDLCMKESDGVLFAGYLSSEWIVWRTHSIETTEYINANETESESATSNTNVFLYDMSSMGMLGISYVLIGIILVSCQRKALLTRKQLRQKVIRKDEDIENLPDL